VSLLSPDTLSLYIEPDRIQAVKAVGFGQRPGEVRQRQATVTASDNWQGMVQVCTELVTQTKAQRVRVVLSDNLVRYACLPWRPELRNTEEELGLLRLNFDDVYGSNASANWHFAISAARPGLARLSVAIPASLFAVLQNNFGPGLPKVQAIQSAFTATLRQHRKQLVNSGWLINLEQGRLTVGSWADDSWQWVYSVHAELNSPEELLARVRQEIRMSSISLKPTQPISVYIHAPAIEHLPLGTLEGVRFIPLKTTNVQAGAKYAFALLGAKA
jgi:hypothetical protein